MKLYDDEGNLDLEAARDELAGAIGQHNEAVYRKTIGAITAAALIDIAASLRPMGLESTIALDEAYGDKPELDNLRAPAPTVAPEDAYAGTRVRLTTPNDKGDYRTGSLAGNDGIDQGFAWVGVLWDGTEAVTKVYADNLEVIPEDGEPIEDTSAEPELTGDVPETTEGYDDPLVDDSTVDEDFDNALEVLEAKTPKKKKAKK